MPTLSISSISVCRHLLAASMIMAAAAGCSRESTPRAGASAKSRVSEDDPVTQRMDTFTMEGFASDGSKRWDLEGTGAAVEGQVVTIANPIGTGYDKQRTAHLRARFGHLNQVNRRVRLEQDVKIHTTDGLWLESPELFWLPDRNEFTTDQVVRLETDHMLIRGRGGEGHTQLKTATILRDVEVILNPTTESVPGDHDYVTITCEGPLSFDYERNIAIFEDRVHVRDPQGDLYSDKLVAYLDKQTRTIAYAEATGHVRIVQGMHTATGGRAMYEPARGKLTLLDAPALMIKLDENGSMWPGEAAQAVPRPAKAR